jgi:hypothetical protein
MAILTISIVDPNDDDFTSASPHLLSNGDAIQMSATTAPSGTVNGTIYYARVISSTEFSIHPTRADAKNGINQIAISSTGTAVTFLVGEPQERIFEFSRIVNHPGSEPIPSVFSDYSRELVFVENVSTEYSRLDVLHSTGGKLVFGKGITTSPTYIFTDSSPKAAPGPEQIKEFWYLT